MQTKIYRKGWMLVLLLLGLVKGQGQEQGSFATTDQQVYIAGERIWVSGIFRGGMPAGTGEVVVYLFNRSGTVMARQQVLPEEETFFTGLPIREQLPSDNYVVAVQAGGRFRLFMPVMIINPVIPPQRPASLQDTGERTGHAFTPLPLKVSGHAFRAREEVQVEVGGQATGLAYFVTVSRKDALSAYADSLFAGWHYTDARVFHQQDQPGVQINARVINSAGQPVGGVPVISALLSNQADVGYALSDRNGRLQFLHPHHYANPPLVFTPLGREPVKFELDAPPDSFAFQWALPALDLPVRFDQDISERVTNTTVSQAYQQEQKTKLSTTQIDTTDFYGAPDKRYILDNYVRFPDMQEILQEFVPEVRVRKNGEKAILQVVNMPYKVFFEQEALVLLDGVPVTDINQLLALDPLKIFAIDVVARKFFVDKMQFHGIVHYKTYKTDLAGYRMQATQMVFDFQGLGLPTVPSYPAQADPRIPDLRNTIFWMTPGALPPGPFRFSSLDVTGTYQIRVTGVDRRGQVFRGEQEIRMN